MIVGGYFPKRITPKPETMAAPLVHEICSVSGCISAGPDDWVKIWLHNWWGWFNRVSHALKAVPPADTSKYRIFAYSLYPEFFRKGKSVSVRVPDDVKPEPLHDDFQSIGFDAASKSMETILGFECSPLSCNSMAVELDVNEFCLFPTLEDAIAGAKRFSEEEPEPGDYYVIEVLQR